MGRHSLQQPQEHINNRNNSNPAVTVIVTVAFLIAMAILGMLAGGTIREKYTNQGNVALSAPHIHLLGNKADRDRQNPDQLLIGEGIRVNGVEYTVHSLKVEGNAAGSQTARSDVTIHNKSHRPLVFGQEQFQLKNSRGETFFSSEGFNKGSLSDGLLVRGDEVNGSICWNFNDTGGVNQVRLFTGINVSETHAIPWDDYVK